MRRVLLATLLVVASLAGCVGDDDAAAPVDDAQPATAMGGLGAASGLPATVERSSATLETPPQWAAGEWWTYRYTDTLFAQEWQATLVVAGVDEEGNYLVGQPIDAFEDRALVLHMPHAGQINAATLGFLTHGVPFAPLQFPLVPGDSWDTTLHGTGALTAVVDAVDGSTATVSMSGAFGMEIQYDAAVGTITKATMSGYGGYELLEHGFGYEGGVRVPSEQELTFCEGRVAVAVAVTMCALPLVPPQVDAPVQIIPVTSDIDRISVGLMVFDLAAGPTGSGAYAMDLTTPAGDTLQNVAVPTGSTASLAAFGVDDPIGDWQLIAASAGAGYNLAEAIGYQVLDVDLPSGCIAGDRVPDYASPC